MTTVVQPEATAPTFDASHQMPIASFSPSTLDPSSYILAQVALVWPYSSSTGTLALLLADTDIRRRKSKGQVKVVFRYGCAREVAKTKVGIGDVVKLALVGCDWSETTDVVSTPGKKLDWDLEYRSRVILQVLRDRQETSAIDYTTDEFDTPPINGATALLNGTYNARPSLDGLLHRRPSTIHVPYLTPQKSLRSVSAGTFIDAALDSLVEDDGYILGRGRKRTKFARNSDAWSLVDSEDETKETARPEPDDGEVERHQSLEPEKVGSTTEPAERAEQYDRVEGVPTEVLSSEAVRTIDEDVVEISSSPPRAETMDSAPTIQQMAMGPPSTPLSARRLQLAPHDKNAHEDSEGSDAATTPRLHPIPSPGLPLVSPLLHRTGVEVGYFPPYDSAISQLDVLGDTVVEALTNEAKAEKEADAESSLSDESLVVMEDVSTPQKVGQAIDSEAVENADHVQVIDQPETEIQIEPTETSKKAIYEEPLWLSSLESTIDQEISHSKEQPSRRTAPQPTPQVVEVEDDDLYGPPADIPELDGSLTDSRSIEPPRSPLDVLEQFLQMSPAVTAGPSMSFGSNGVGSILTTPLQQNVPESVTTEIRQEKTSITVLPNRSPVTYPESQSPFRQNRDQQTSSNASSRRSSDHRTRPRSLDGTVDEREPFAEYINHLSQVAATVKSAQRPAANVELVKDHIQKDVSMEADVPAVVEIQENVHMEFIGGVAEEAIRKTDERATIEPTEELDLLASSGSTGQLDQGVTGSVLLEPVHGHEAQAQLPTPDQTQVQQPSPSPEAEDMPKRTQELTEAALPSPQYTQEEVAPETQEDETTATWQEEEALRASPVEIARLLEEKAAETMQEVSVAAMQEEPTQGTRKELPQVVVRKELRPQSTVTSATPAIATTMSVLQPDTIAPRRISQRLSARKSIMATNISSPYFAPRKSSQAPSSSPTRKENIHPTTPDRVSFISSPIQEKTKASLLSTPIQEVEQNGIDITPLSPTLRTKRPVSRRHTGTTTPLAYYAHLSSLHEHFGQVVDILAACTESSSQPERSKSGPKDHHTTLRLADPSLSSDQYSAVSAQIFRPAKSALPTVSGGDVVILRNFKVQTSNRRFMFLSTDTSSWAVFKAKPDSTTSWSDVVVSGPPIEYGPAETSRVKLLFSWWKKNGKEHVSPSPAAGKDREEVEFGSPELRSRSPKLKEAPQTSSKARPARRRREANWTDNFGNENAVDNFFASFNGDNVSMIDDDVNEDEAANNVTVPLSPPEGRGANATSNIANGTGKNKVSSSRRKANRTDHYGNEGDEDMVMLHDEREQSVPFTDTTNQRRQSTVSLAASESGRAFTPRRSARQRQKKSPSVVHELRDGTRYIDDDRTRSGSVVHELRDGVTYVDE